jgi:xylulokinase
MASVPVVLAVDLGTSGPKAAVITVDGRAIGTARRHVDTVRLDDGGVEQDAESVWAAVVAAARSALAESGVGPGDVEAVICASQYSSIVPVDANGVPVGPMILWQDQRGAPHSLRRLPRAPSRIDTPVDLARWLRLHGLPPIDGGISLNHMRYLRYGRPEVYAHAAYLLEPMDYLTMRLTGRATANQSTAFMQLLVDNRTLDARDYSPTLLARSRIDPTKLPELVPMDTVIGPLLPGVADALGLRSHTRVVTGLNDTQAGAIGSGAFTGSHGGLSVGSTGVLITHVDRKHTDVRRAVLSMPSPVPGKYFVMAENGMAGAVLESFIDLVVRPVDELGDAEPEDAFERLERAAGRAPAGSNGLLFLPWIGGSMAPAVDARMRGGFLGISRSTTRNDMARAVLEGVALNLQWLREAVERFTARELTYYRCYGGGARSALWCQIMADALGRPLHRLDEGEYTVAIGAGLLAFERLGRVSFDEIAGLVRTAAVFEPDADDVELYRRLGAQLRTSFKQTRPIFTALAELRP